MNAAIQNAAIQHLISAAPTLQPSLCKPEEYTTYSGPIGGLTAANLTGATPELINQWEGCVQGGTSLGPNLRPDILFKDSHDDIVFARACFDHLYPVT